MFRLRSSVDAVGRPGCTPGEVVVARDALDFRSSPMVRILVSACLLGRPVRYDGTDNAVEDAILRRWRCEGRIVPVCPEIEGGLGVPRPPAEISEAAKHDAGGAVIDGRSRVETESGRDVTDAYLSGASAALEAAREHGARLAVLKDGSPSCGRTYVYDGSFGDESVAARGVTAALLEREGVRVFSESQIRRAADVLAALEA